ncbi:MAG TPA: DUF3025 domain-containing protein [Burkholderiales bacterium]|jgi:hypothetical protein
MDRIMEWDPGFLARSPMFEPLRALGGALATPEWPTRQVLQNLLERGGDPVVTRSGLPVRLVPAGGRMRSFEERYEARVHFRGEMVIRDRNWHDLLNVLVWLTFPCAKAALNARHFQALEAQRAAGAANRGPAQDALTLFDEGGVIVASRDKKLLELLAEWRWKELFWGNRARLQSRMSFLLFGHALYEKALHPFLGITGRGVVLDVEPELLAESPGRGLGELDSRLAATISDSRNLTAARDLAVVPILGVPGWHRDNEREGFYDDQDYFRPGRIQDMRDNHHPSPPSPR